jgi:cob(I)alamin adenosyltransferase
MKRTNKGCVQVYTGNGKGKTTAALGQALRAAGCGLKTYIAQFMKSSPSCEIESLKYLHQWIRLEQFGNNHFITKKKNPDRKDILLARQALKHVRKKMMKGEYDILVLDEVCTALYFNLLKTGDILTLLEEKPESVELILTGRYCPTDIIEKANLSTEMREIKHYYRTGMPARAGIEQ